MSESTNPVADLILARLAMPSKNPPAPGAILKDIAPLVRGGLTKERVDAILKEFRTAGLLPSKGQALTDAGQARAMAYLGLEQLPAKCNWAMVKAKFLIPKSLGLTPWSAAEVARVGTADKLAARLLKEKYQLPVSADANLTGVLESLVCKLSGFTDCVNLKELSAQVISRELKTDALPAKDAMKLAPRLLLGTTKSGVEGYRMKVLAGSIEDRPHKDELKEFADRVIALAPKCPTGWFGDNKVFLSHLWRYLHSNNEYLSLDLAAFKSKLLDAQRKGYITLSRADLVQAMDPTDVQQSEVSYLNAEYHFILISKGT